MSNYSTSTAGSITTAIRLADSPSLCTREHRNAHREIPTDVGTPTIDLTISRLDAESGAPGLSGKYRVRWNMNRGNGWTKAKISKAVATEIEAREIADRVWGQLMAWLEACEAKAAAPIGLPNMHR